MPCGRARRVYGRRPHLGVRLPRRRAGAVRCGHVLPRLLPGDVRRSPAARSLEGVPLQSQRLARRHQRRPGGRGGRGGVPARSRARPHRGQASCGSDEPRLSARRPRPARSRRRRLLARRPGCRDRVGGDRRCVPRHGRGGRGVSLDVGHRHLPGGDAARHPLAADGDPARHGRLGSPGPRAADHPRGPAVGRDADRLHADGARRLSRPTMSRGSTPLPSRSRR